MPWHVAIMAIFIVGISIYIISTNNDKAGWIYVILLLLGITVAVKSFPYQLSLFVAGQ